MSRAAEGDVQAGLASRDVPSLGIGQATGVQIGSGNFQVNHFHGAPEVNASAMPLMPLDFSGYAEQKQHEFTGRKWLFDSLQSWRLEKSERALLITGEPGSGKSAFAAELLNRTPQDGVLGFHFCTAEDHSTLDPAVFVTHLAATIKRRFPGYDDILHRDEQRRMFRLDAVERDPGHALDQGIIAPLRRLAITEDQLLVVDGLDEALLVPDQANSILTLLAPRLDRFPRWVKVVITARPEPQVLARLGGVRVLQIDVRRADNLRDVREFIGNRLAAPAWRNRLKAEGISVSEVQERLTADDKGNFLYVTMMLKSIELDRHLLSELDEPPPGLSGAYREFFERIFSDARSYELARGLLEVMVAAQAPLPDEVLQATSGINDPYSLSAALTALATLMPRYDGRYAFFHQSVAHWVSGQDHPFRAHPRNGHTRLAHGFLHYLRQTADTVHHLAPGDSIGGYWVTYGLDHLAQGGQCLPGDLPPAAFAQAAIPAKVDNWDYWTSDAPPAHMRRYVRYLLRNRMSEDMVTLIELVARVAAYYYTLDGFLRERVREDGQVVYDIVGEATSARNTAVALQVSGYAGAIYGAVRNSSELTLTSDQATRMRDWIRFLRYIARGIETGGWARKLSHSFEDASHFIVRDLDKLLDVAN